MIQYFTAHTNCGCQSIRSMLEYLGYITLHERLNRSQSDFFIIYKTFIRYSKVHNRKKCLTLFFLHRYHSNNAATKPSEFNQFKAYFFVLLSPNWILESRKGCNFKLHKKCFYFKQVFLQYLNNF